MLGKADVDGSGALAETIQCLLNLSELACKGFLPDKDQEGLGASFWGQPTPELDDMILALLRVNTGHAKHPWALDIRFEQGSGSRNRNAGDLGLSQGQAFGWIGQRGLREFDTVQDDFNVRVIDPDGGVLNLEALGDGRDLVDKIGEEALVGRVPLGLLEVNEAVLGVDNANATQGNEFSEHGVN